MQSPGREPSMEDILASIKKVIAEEKELRTRAAVEAVRTSRAQEAPQARGRARARRAAPPPADLGPPLLDEEAAGQSRHALERFERRRNRPGAPVNPLEDMVREMLRPI